MDFSKFGLDKLLENISSDDVEKGMQKLKQKKQEKIYQGTAGAGEVIVKINSDRKIVNINVNEKLHSENINTIIELITVSNNIAQEKANEEQKSICMTEYLDEFQDVVGGMFGMQEKNQQNNTKVDETNSDENNNTHETQNSVFVSDVKGNVTQTESQNKTPDDEIKTHKTEKHKTNDSEETNNTDNK